MNENIQFYIAQGIGFIGMVVMFIAFQQNDKRKLLWVQASASAVFTAHFLLLGAFTGMGMNLVSIPRNLIFARKPAKKQQLIWTAVFIAAFAAFGIITWDTVFSLFPVIAMSLSTIVFSLKEPRYIRFLSLPISGFWITYNIISFSIAGVLTEAFVICSILIAIVRFDILKRTENKK